MEWSDSLSETLSRSIRSMANRRSSAVKSHIPAPVFECGKSGRSETATRPRAKLAAPSMMNSHCHPASPLEQQLEKTFGHYSYIYYLGAYLAPSKPAKIPAANNPENAVASTRPEYRIAVLKASSFLVYQHESM